MRSGCTPSGEAIRVRCHQPIVDIRHGPTRFRRARGDTTLAAARFSPDPQPARQEHRATVIEPLEILLRFGTATPLAGHESAHFRDAGGHHAVQSSALCGGVSRTAVGTCCPTVQSWLG